MGLDNERCKSSTGKYLIMADKLDIGSIFKERLAQIKTSKKFLPTGLMEKMIIAVGECYKQYDIVLAQMPNKVGKTRHAVEILKNIMWSNDKDYFDYPLYNDYPFINADKSKIRTIRIVSDPTHVGDGGAIREEIMRVWPRGRYQEDKDGKHYYSRYTTDTGWNIAVMTYEQDPKEFESKLVSLQWLDEPADPKILGAVTSRMSKGGLVIMTFTPVNRNAGAIIDVLDDLEAQGTKIKRLSGEIEDNSSETGILNSKGTMRGLMTNDEITNYIKMIPLHEREQRLKGKATHKSGKVYPEFNRAIHVKEYDLDTEYINTGNPYMAADPHPRGYYFMLWGLVLPDERLYIWNEWPDYNELGKHYDESRSSDICPYAPSQLAEMIKVLDGTSFGLKRPRRYIDPNFAKGTVNTWDRKSEGIIAEYIKYDIYFNMPPYEQIAQQRNHIHEMLIHDIEGGVYPQLVISPRCQNLIRALERHYWEDGAGEIESEKYKDAVDTLRYMLAGISKIRYKESEKATMRPLPSQDVRDVEIKSYADEMRSCAN